MEPALEYMRHEFAGAVYAGHDQIGDAHAFTEGLCRWLVEHRSVTLRLDEEVIGLEVKKGRLLGVRTAADMIETDVAVVCLGPWSPELLSPHGINPRIYPVRGYSVTLPLGKHAPTMSITNLAQRILHSRLNDRIRVTGFADFVGFDTSNDGQRISSLLEIAERLAPEAADYDAGQHSPWGGFRPVTPNGRPEVGPTKIGGLFLNTGHGSLGWTLACATAETVAVAIGNSE
jgi:D-amino-acid dehydrogenase